MNTEVKAVLGSLYEVDYQSWLEQTVAQLRARDFGNLDLDNLIEEIESLGKRDRRAIARYLMRLCEHLLKLRYWETERAMCFRGWCVEVANFRLQIQALLNDSPSLKNYLDEIFRAEYTNARKLMLTASGLPANTIPQEPAWTLAQVLDEDWLPWKPEVG